MPRKRKLVSDLEVGLKEIVAVIDGKVVPRRLHDFRSASIADIRRALGLSQVRFASRFGLNVRTIQDWEQGRSLPDQPARVLLKVIAKSPNAVARAVAGA